MIRRSLVALMILAASLPAVGSALPAAPAVELPVPLFTTTLVANLTQPVAGAVRTGDDAMYIVEQVGRVTAIRDGAADPTPVLDITDSVSSSLEQGLLGLAFSPDGNYLYIHYTDLDGDSRIVEYAFVDGLADVDSRRELIFVEQPFNNHNCGSLVFGPDGYLYICFGDGGSAGDPHANSQDLSTLLGKMLRIDPRGSEPYGIPSDNPFVDVPGARPEIWAYGLRNPWKFTFDRSTGDLWIADVGQSLWEEVNFQPADSPGGENYGWKPMEGTRPYQDGVEPENHTPPVYEYTHAQGCSVTGGYVYRGTKIPALRGTYVFADWCAGRIWALADVAGTKIAMETGVSVPAIASFAQDNKGELYGLSLGGPIFRFDPVITL